MYLLLKSFLFSQFKVPLFERAVKSWYNLLLVYQSKYCCRYDLHLALQTKLLLARRQFDWENWKASFHVSENFFWEEYSFRQRCMRRIDSIDTYAFEKVVIGLCYLEHVSLSFEWFFSHLYQPPLLLINSTNMIVQKDTTNDHHNTQYTTISHWITKV